MAHACLQAPPDSRRAKKLATDAAILLTVLPDSVRSMDEWEATNHDEVPDSSLSNWEIAAAKAVLRRMVATHQLAVVNAGDCCARAAASRLVEGMQSWAPPRGITDLQINATDTVLRCAATGQVVRFTNMLLPRPWWAPGHTPAPHLKAARRSQPILGTAGSR